MITNKFYNISHTFICKYVISNDNKIISCILNHRTTAICLVNSDRKYVYWKTFSINNKILLTRKQDLQIFYIEFIIKCRCWSWWTIMTQGQFLNDQNNRFVIDCFQILIKYCIWILEYFYTKLFHRSQV